MDDCQSFWPALFVALPATIGAVGALVTGLRNGRKVGEVKDAVNGRVEQLMAARERAAHERGHIAGRADQRGREGD